MKQKLTEGERKQTLFFFLRELGFRLVSVQELSKVTVLSGAAIFHECGSGVVGSKPLFVSSSICHQIRLRFGRLLFFLLLNKVCKIQVFSNMSQFNSNPLSVNLGGKNRFSFFIF